METKGNNKVVVGLSGGVDSAVSAYLLLKQGYEVIGVNINNMCKNDPNCMAYRKAKKEGLDASMIAKKLNIQFESVENCTKFKIITDYFVRSYNSGKTPNPCIECNPKVKWMTLMEAADRLGAQYIATGHYARVVRLDNGRYAVAKGISLEKDQSYVISYLSQEQLARTLTPLGEYDKREIRKIAKEIGFHVAEKKDSQDICFVPDGRYANFIWRYTGERAIPGEIVDVEGNVIGKHKGIIFYTIGQSKGLAVDLGERVYVKNIDYKNNRIMVAKEEDLYSEVACANNLNFMAYDGSDEYSENDYYARIRYGTKMAKCKIKVQDNQLECHFEEAQRAITPGQIAVIYNDKDEIVLAGELLPDRCCCVNKQC
ncbi:MAG: tRNA 2-thiouridine(34) synthase MnmA [Lachnospiraceae bacterium]|nr:tRNA 2-thiouridine(34) synthase MnmA [Lachnospiraceae bacterium]